jgi:hypothetical protein
MRTYYFVGGPAHGHEDSFFRRLAPHANGDGRALHVVEVAPRPRPSEARHDEVEET